MVKGNNFVHFIDEQELHYVAVVLEEHELTRNLCVYEYAHVRIAENVPYSPDGTSYTWHNATMQGLKSICESDRGYISFNENEQAVFNRLVEHVRGDKFKREEQE